MRQGKRCHKQNDVLKIHAFSLKVQTFEERLQDVAREHRTKVLRAYNFVTERRDSVYMSFGAAQREAAETECAGHVLLLSYISTSFLENAIWCDLRPHHNEHERSPKAAFVAEACSAVLDNSK